SSSTTAPDHKTPGPLVAFLAGRSMELPRFAVGSGRSRRQTPIPPDGGRGCLGRVATAPCRGNHVLRVRLYCEAAERWPAVLSPFLYGDAGMAGFQRHTHQS